MRFVVDVDFLAVFLEDEELDAFFDVFFLLAAAAFLGRAADLELDDRVFFAGM